MGGMTTNAQYVGQIAEVTRELEILDDLRTHYLHKRALLIAAAFETDIKRMEIAIAAGVTQARTYAISAQVRGITPASQRLAQMYPPARFVEPSEESAWSSDDTQWAPVDHWIAFPMPEPDADL